MPKGDARARREIRECGVPKALFEPGLRPLISFGILESCAKVDALPIKDSPDWKFFEDALVEWVLVRPSIVAEGVAVMASQYEADAILHRGKRGLRTYQELMRHEKEEYDKAIQRKSVRAPLIPLATTLLSENVLVHAVRAHPKGTVQACVDWVKHCEHVPELLPSMLHVVEICMQQGPAMAAHLTRAKTVAIRNAAIAIMKDPRILEEMAIKGIYTGGPHQMAQSPIATYMEHTAALFVDNYAQHEVICKSFERREWDENRFLSWVVSPQRLYIESTFEPHTWYEHFVGRTAVPEDFIVPEQDMERAKAAVAHYRGLKGLI